MHVTLEIPGDVAERLQASGGNLSRRALEAFALEEYKRGRLSTPEMRRLLGFWHPLCARWVSEGP